MSYLRELRRSRSLTYLDLAMLTGIPARALAEAEHGLRPLSRGEYGQLAFVLGLNDSRALTPQAEAVAQQPGIIPSARQVMVVAALAGSIAVSVTQPQVQTDFRIPTFRPLVVATARPSPLFGAATHRAEARTPAPTAPVQPTATPLATRPIPAAATLPPTFFWRDDGPHGCPLIPRSGTLVLTQGYGVGTHAPANVWGGIDLAVDGDGDGIADPAATLYTPVVATHGGVALITPGSWPAGNHIWIEDRERGWRSGYAHLAQILVSNEQVVQAGDLIGLVGSTGMSNGPHLHYHVWQGARNVDPTELACWGGR